MENLEQKPVIKKKMEKETAIKLLNEIRENIGGVDLETICDENNEITPENINDEITKRLIQAIQCGLVYWDENENVLIQKLIRPLKSGDMSANELKYQYKLTIRDLKMINTPGVGELEVFENALAQITGKGRALIGRLSGQDIQIASGCLGFFAQ